MRDLLRKIKHRVGAIVLAEIERHGLTVVDAEELRLLRFRTSLRGYKHLADRAEEAEHKVAHLIAYSQQVEAKLEEAQEAARGFYTDHSEEHGRANRAEAKLEALRARRDRWKAAAKANRRGWQHCAPQFWPLKDEEQLP